MRREPGLYQVRMNHLGDVRIQALIEWDSNLTFGAGGKDKDGNNVVGWGYYEVCFSPLSLALQLMDVIDDRRWLGRRPRLARNIRHPHAHHQHSHW